MVLVPQSVNCMVHFRALSRKKKYGWISCVVLELIPFRVGKNFKSLPQSRILVTLRA